MTTTQSERLTPEQLAEIRTALDTPGTSPVEVRTHAATLLAEVERATRHENSLIAEVAGLGSALRAANTLNVVTCANCTEQQSHCGGCGVELGI